MSTPKQDILSGTLLDESIEYTLVDLCEFCAVEVQLIVEMVDYGILEPKGSDRSEWCFTGSCVQRITTVVRLHEDLGVNIAGAALALELMDELKTLRGNQGLD